MVVSDLLLIVVLSSSNSKSDSKKKKQIRIRKILSFFFENGDALFFAFSRWHLSRILGFTFGDPEQLENRARENGLLLSF